MRILTLGQKYGLPSQTCGKSALMNLHLLRMRRNVNRNVFNDRKNVSATAVSGQTWRRLYLRF